jgi:Tol biopolymer transport system component
MGMRGLWAAVSAGVLAVALAAGPARAELTLDQALGYSYISGLTAAEHADRIAWVQNVRGVRNVWVADGPAFTPRQVTRYLADDGQEITQLTFSPDGARLLYVRGGDHDANWPADKNLAPDPANDPQEPKVTIWSASLSGGEPTKVAEGDAPALSARGVLAYVKDDQVWTASLDGRPSKGQPAKGVGKPEQLFFDRGKDGSLVWSPDGSRLAFISGRSDHAFVGVFTDTAHPLTYLAPSTGRDGDPAWSPDGERIAFTRQPGDGGAPEPLLTHVPHPFAIWTADATTGEGRQVWKSPNTLDGSYPESITGVNLTWGAEGRIGFTADLDGWRHLYSVPATGGEATLLTPGRFIV